MNDFVQNCLDGIMLGSSYALLGLGFTLTFGIMRQLNLSYGPTLMFGVYAGSSFSLFIFSSLIASLVVAMSVAVLAGLVVDRVSFRWVKSENPLASMVSAFTLWMVFEEIIVLFTWGRRYPVENPIGLEPLKFGPFYLRGDYLFLFCIAAVLMSVIWLLVYRTATGRQMRAIAENASSARVVGIDVPRVSTKVVVIVHAVGALVAYFIAASLYQITPNFGLWATLKGLIVMVIGGVGSITGAVLGGLMLGVVETQTTWYLGTNFRDLTAFFLLFVLLVIAPRGLLTRFTKGGTGHE
ncbi:branched-chain amino acid ABC transporter permease [Pseudohalocynthiibacter sp. F2068]|uniref:branched-chain amino acid ABC transporter permease n=1 Tax=Pseudohalocynthiibacter sp. F2068 TaxID=2926418 RepID=UPI001FF23AAA|nr:branched-chain amino acid ABC transporter permease [Pseudohalocynthiibacter sp. F2068]MCK0103243.1 branched-chain amino acid ABC transporter permease [Pseudohalocynthiibacter sp. F2068]